MSTENTPLSAEYDLLVLDCDGVLWHDDEAIEGSIEALKALDAAGKSSVLVTNSSATSRQRVVQKLIKLGYPAITLDRVYTSGQAVGRLVAKKYGAGTHVYVVGEEGMCEELRLAGLVPVGGQDDAGVKVLSSKDFQALPIDERVKAVIVGWDRAFSFGKLCLASLYLQAGAELFASNLDAYDLAPPKGHWPGAGCMVAAIEASVNRPGTAVVAGKPSATIIEFIRQDFPNKKMMMVGDRMDTDVKFGLDAGLDACLVLTGVSKLEDATRGPEASRPTFVRGSLRDIVGNP